MCLCVRLRAHACACACACVQQTLCCQEGGQSQTGGDWLVSGVGGISASVTYCPSFPLSPVNPLPPPPPLGSGSGREHTCTPHVTSLKRPSPTHLRPPPSSPHANPLTPPSLNGKEFNLLTRKRIKSEVLVFLRIRRKTSTCPLKQIPAGATRKRHRLQ